MNRAKALQLNLEVQRGFHLLRDNYFRDQGVVDLEGDIPQKKPIYYFQQNLNGLLDFEINPVVFGDYSSSIEEHSYKKRVGRI